MPRPASEDDRSGDEGDCRDDPFPRLHVPDEIHPGLLYCVIYIIQLWQPFKASARRAIFLPPPPRFK
jgi:hypothetical protein